MNATKLVDIADKLANQLVEPIATSGETNRTTNNNERDRLTILESAHRRAYLAHQYAELKVDSDSLTPKHGNI